MKKITVSAGLLLISICLVFAAGNKDTSARPKQINLVMATGGTSGTYYPYGGAVAQTLGAAIPGLNINIQATGASAANIRLVATDEADIAIVQNDAMNYAYNGTETFKGQPVTDFLTMATVYSEVCQIIADAGSDIKSVADLKGKRVSIGDAGSGVESNAIQILAAYGITTNDIRVQNLSFADSASAIKDKKIDAFFCTAGIPTTAVVELSTTNAVTVVPIDADKIVRLIADYPFYTGYTIKKDAYRGMTTDVPTVAVKATLIVNNKLDETIVYNMTKTLFENRDEIAAAHAKGLELDLEKAVQGASVPFHPGALKYFKEVGVIK